MVDPSIRPGGPPPKSMDHHPTTTAVAVAGPSRGASRQQHPVEMSRSVMQQPSRPPYRYSFPAGNGPPVHPHPPGILQPPPPPHQLDPQSRAQLYAQLQSQAQHHAHLHAQALQQAHALATADLQAYRPPSHSFHPHPHWAQHRPTPNRPLFTSSPAARPPQPQLQKWGPPTHFQPRPFDAIPPHAMQYTPPMPIFAPPAVQSQHASFPAYPIPPGLFQGVPHEMPRPVKVGDGGPPAHKRPRLESVLNGPDGRAESGPGVSQAPNTTSAGNDPRGGHAPEGGPLQGQGQGQGQRGPVLADMMDAYGKLNTATPRSPLEGPPPVSVASTKHSLPEHLRKDSLGSNPPSRPPDGAPAPASSSALHLKGKGDDQSLSTWAVPPPSAPGEIHPLLLTPQAIELIQASGNQEQRCSLCGWSWPWTYFELKPGRARKFQKTRCQECADPVRAARRDKKLRIESQETFMRLTEEHIWHELHPGEKLPVAPLIPATLSAEVEQVKADDVSSNVGEANVTAPQPGGQAETVATGAENGVIEALAERKNDDTRPLEHDSLADHVEADDATESYPTSGQFNGASSKVGSAEATSSVVQISKEPIAVNSSTASADPSPDLKVQAPAIPSAGHIPVEPRISSVPLSPIENLQRRGEALARIVHMTIPATSTNPDPPARPPPPIVAAEPRSLTAPPVALDTVVGQAQKVADEGIVPGTVVSSSSTPPLTTVSESLPPLTGPTTDSAASRTPAMKPISPREAKLLFLPEPWRSRAYLQIYYETAPLGEPNGHPLQPDAHDAPPAPIRQKAMYSKYASFLNKLSVGLVLRHATEGSTLTQAQLTASIPTARSGNEFILDIPRIIKGSRLTPEGGYSVLGIQERAQPEWKVDTPLALLGYAKSDVSAAPLQELVDTAKMIATGNLAPGAPPIPSGGAAGGQSLSTRITPPSSANPASASLVDGRAPAGGSAIASLNPSQGGMRIVPKTQSPLDSINSIPGRPAMSTQTFPSRPVEAPTQGQTEATATTPITPVSQGSTDTARLFGGGRQKEWMAVAASASPITPVSGKPEGIRTMPDHASHAIPATASALISNAPPPPFAADDAVRSAAQAHPDDTGPPSILPPSVTLREPAPLPRTASSNPSISVPIQPRHRPPRLSHHPSAAAAALVLKGSPAGPTHVEGNRPRATVKRESIGGKERQVWRVIDSDDEDEDEDDEAGAGAGAKAEG